MSSKLLIRSYDVGFGDCIYVKIPDGKDHFHMLIDCGTSGSPDKLKRALGDLVSELPLENGKRRLDLLVVTHPHADHIKGFDPQWFADVTIRRIWLSAFMKADHPQAKQALALQAVAGVRSEALLNRSGPPLALGAWSLLDRSRWSIANPGALDALREGLAQASGIYPQFPLYVARDLATELKPEQRGEYQLDLNKGTTRFRGFHDKSTCLRILAPEWDIDKCYLGKGSFDSDSLIDEYLLGSEACPPGEDDTESATATDGPPSNISERDYRVLRSRLAYSALAFSQRDDALKNDTSVVLLLEWRGRRLLFAGDAEWQGTDVQEGRRNGTWDVMLHHAPLKQTLLEGLDVLKVAHHGSQNGTPFLRGGQPFLESMLGPRKTEVVVSTMTGVHPGEQYPVPYPALLQLLGSLAANKRRYPDSVEPELREVDQPQRTDLEPPVPGKQVRYVEVALSGAG